MDSRNLPRRFSVGTFGQEDEKNWVACDDLACRLRFVRPATQLNGRMGCLPTVPLPANAPNRYFGKQPVRNAI